MLLNYYYQFRLYNYMYMYMYIDIKQNAVQLYMHQMTCIMHMCTKSHIKYMYMYTWLSLSHDRHMTITLTWLLRQLPTESARVPMAS